MSSFDSDSITRPLVDPAKRKQLKETISIDDYANDGSCSDFYNIDQTLPFKTSDNSKKTSSGVVKNYINKNASRYDASQLALPVTAKRRVSLITMSILVVVAFISAFLGVTYSMQLWGGKEIPNTIGYEQMFAQSTIEKVGFVPKIEFQYSDESEGVVISQDPASGVRAEEGSIVTLYISKPRIMPDLVNLSIDDAKKQLEDIGANNIEIKEEQSDNPENTVLNVSVNAGEKIFSDTLIVLTVATPHLIPDVIGMSMRQAVATLEDAGYITSIGEEANEDVAEDCVISMQPSANSALSLGKNVTIIVAIHPSNTLIAEVQSYFNGVSDFRFNSKDYELLEVVSVRYSGSNTCEFKLKARPYEIQSWGADNGRRRYGAITELSGSVILGNDGNISSFNPSLEKL